MPLTERQLKERKSAIGGSDVPALLGLPPFGCTRRLWYDKKGVPEDFPFRGNRHTRRGEVMEEIAVMEYFEHTARGVRRGIPWKVDDEIPYFGVHADALQEIEECGPKSVLEVKCPSARWFFASRHKPDPPNEAMAQLQWGMMVHRLRAGTVLMFCADQWALKWWDVGNDDMMQSDLRAIGIKFWSTLKTWPSSRCAT
jgi:predicted phage-related endonuclease